MLYNLCIITLTTCVIGGVLGGRGDPPNATYFYSNNVLFNVSSLYWRERFVNSPQQRVTFWLNPYELPEKMLYYENDHWHLITHDDTIYRLVLDTINRAFRDWSVRSEKLNFVDYYVALGEMNYFNNRHAISGLNLAFYRRRSRNYPMHVHFRYDPYPQSTFGEFVSNREITWRVWRHHEDYVREPREHVGEVDDLLFRMRHNVGHSLGLGHSYSNKCILHNIRMPGLYDLCEAEKEAMRQFLHNSTLIVYNRVAPLHARHKRLH